MRSARETEWFDDDELWSALTIYSGQELRELLEQTGFTDVKLFGCFDGAAYDQNAKRLIAVARRSA